MLILGHDFRSNHALDRLGFKPGMHADNAARAEQLFQQRQPAQPEYQSVNADVDQDGDEDATAVRFLPIAPIAGLSFATGTTQDLELKPLKLFKGLNFTVDPATAAKFIITSMLVGQDDIAVAKGGIPLAGLVSNETNDLLDLPWAGPGLSIYLSLKNIDSGTQIFHGAIRGLAVVG